MMRIKKLRVSNDVTEYQVWKDDVFVGAGAYSEPVTMSDEEIMERIVGVWLCGT